MCGTSFKPSTEFFLYVDDITEPVFLNNPMMQDAVIRNFEIIGEASRNIERYHPDFARAHADIPWADL